MFPCFAGMGPQGVEPRGSPAQTTRRDAYYSGDPRDREPPREHSAQRGPTGLQTSPITPEHGQYYAGQQGEDPWSTFQPLPPPNYYGMFPSYAPYGPQYGPQGLVSGAYGGFGAPHLRFRDPHSRGTRHPGRLPHHRRRLLRGPRRSGPCAGSWRTL